MKADFALVIRGGTVVDGAGSEPYAADVAIRDGRIGSIGRDLGRARQEIDARGPIGTGRLATVCMSRRRLLETAGAAALLSAGLPVAAQEKSRILIVSTSHAEAPNERKTGLWLSDLSEPYWIFREAGYGVDIASIQGGTPPIDPRSGSDRALPGRLRNDEAAQRAFSESICVDCINPRPYVALFLAGGHGALWDFPKSESLRGIVGRAASDGKPIGAVGHGPAGLLGVHIDGKPLVAGRRLTAHTDEEEERAGWTAHIPYSLEQRLKADGASVQSAAAFRSNAVRDGLLVTGQNPASAEATARLLLGALRQG
jgi:putative intracellular protease/amidase